MRGEEFKGYALATEYQRACLYFLPECEGGNKISLRACVYISPARLLGPDVG